MDSLFQAENLIVWNSVTYVLCVSISFRSPWSVLEGIGAAFAGANADSIGDFRDKDFAIAKFARLGGGDDCLEAII